jgi:hypothetical protein
LAVLNVKPQNHPGAGWQPPQRRKVELNDHYQTWLVNYNEIRKEVNSASALSTPRTLVYRNEAGSIGVNKIYMNEMVLGTSNPYADPATVQSDFVLTNTEFKLGPNIDVSFGGPVLFGDTVTIGGAISVGGIDSTGPSNFTDLVSFGSIVSFGPGSQLVANGQAIFNNQVFANDGLDVTGATFFNGAIEATGDVIIEGSVDIEEDLIVRGNLSVLGVRTQLEVSELVVEDKNILINKNDLYTPLNSGIFIQKGTDVEAGFFRVHDVDDKYLQFKAPSAHTLTLDIPYQDVTLRLEDDFSVDQSLTKTSNVTFRSLTLDDNYARHSGVPGYVQSNLDIIANTRGWISTPWTYTNVVESFSDLTTQNTTGLFMGTTFWTNRHETALVNQGKESIFITDMGKVGLGTTAPTTQFQLYQNEPVLSITSDNYTKPSAIQLKDLNDDISSSGLQLVYDANTALGTLEVTTQSLTSGLNLSVGGLNSAPEVKILSSDITMNTDLFVKGEVIIDQDLITENTLYVRPNRVGINVINPAEELDVSGNIHGDSDLILDGIEPFIRMGTITTLVSSGRSGLVVEEESPLIQLSTTDSMYRHGTILFLNDDAHQRRWSLGTVNNGDIFDIGKSFNTALNIPEHGLDEYHGETLLRLNGASDKAFWYLSADDNNPAMILNTRTNGVHLYLGEQTTIQTGERSTIIYGPNDYSSVIQWHGTTSSRGELSYFPNGNDDHEYGSFRFSRKAGGVNTGHPTAKVGVHQLYAHDKIAVSNTAPTAELHIQKDQSRILQETESSQQYFSVTANTNDVHLIGENVPGWSSFELLAMNPAISRLRSRDYKVETKADHSPTGMVTSLVLDSDGNTMSFVNDNLNGISGFEIARPDKIYRLNMDNINHRVGIYLQNHVDTFSNLDIKEQTFDLTQQVIDSKVHQHIDRTANTVWQKMINQSDSSAEFILRDTIAEDQFSLATGQESKRTISTTNIVDRIEFTPTNWTNLSISAGRALLETRADNYFYTVDSNKTGNTSRLKLQNDIEYFQINIDNPSQQSLLQLTSPGQDSILAMDDVNQFALFKIDSLSGYKDETKLDIAAGTTYNQLTTQKQNSVLTLNESAASSRYELQEDTATPTEYAYDMHLDRANQTSYSKMYSGNQVAETLLFDASMYTRFLIDGSNNYYIKKELNRSIESGYKAFSVDNRMEELNFHPAGATTKTTYKIDQANNYIYQLNLDEGVTRGNIDMSVGDQYNRYIMDIQKDDVSTISLSNKDFNNRYAVLIDAETTVSDRISVANGADYFSKTFYASIPNRKSESRISVDVEEYELVLDNANERVEQLIRRENQSAHLTMADNAGTPSTNYVFNNSNNFVYDLFLDQSVVSTTMTAGTNVLRHTNDSTTSNTSLGFNGVSYTLKHIDPSDNYLYTAWRDHIDIWVDTFFAANATFNGPYTTFNSEVVFSPTSNTNFHGPLSMHDEVWFSPTSNTLIDGETTYGPGSNTTVHGTTTYSASSSTEIHGETTYGPGSNTTVEGTTTYSSNSTTEIHGETTYGPGSNTTVDGTTTYSTNSTTTIEGETVYGPGSNTTIEGSTTYSTNSTTEINGDTTYSTTSTTNVEGDTVYGPTSTTTVDGDTTYTTNSTTTIGGDTVYTTDSTTTVEGDTVYTTNSTTTVGGDTTYTTTSVTNVQGDTVYAPGSNTVIEGTTVYGPGSHTVEEGTIIFKEGSNTEFRGNTTVYTPMYFPPGIKSDLTFHLTDSELSDNWEYPNPSNTPPTPNTKYIVWHGVDTHSKDAYIYYGALTSGTNTWGVNDSLPNSKLFINADQIDFSFNNDQNMLINTNEILVNKTVKQSHIDNLFEYRNDENKWLLKARTADEGIYWNKTNSPSYSLQSYGESTNPENIQNQIVFAGGSSAKAAIDLDTGTIRAKGDVIADGDIISFVTSDGRFKTNINNIRPQDKIKRLRGVHFTWKEDNPHGYTGDDVGVIAQELESVVPEAVRKNADGHYQVNYEKVIPLLIEVIKKQDIRQDLLEEELRTIKRHIGLL